MMDAVQTRLVDLRVRDNRLEIDLHSTTSDPVVHIYAQCGLKNITPEECRDLAAFFKRLELLC